MQRSCLSYSSKSSNHTIRYAENGKFKKDARSAGPIQYGATKRLVPLEMNHFSLRGGHFNALLKEIATILVTCPKRCPLMNGPFALSMKGSLRKILQSWGSRLTWIDQRQHAAHIVDGIDSYLYNSSFFSVL